jgi:hypothetical protein
MSAVLLCHEQERQAQAPAARIREAVDKDILELARLLVSKPEHEVFGQTEFEVRDIVHQLGATALRTHLAGKKRLPGRQRRLPRLRPGRRVPRLSPEEAAEPAGGGLLPPGLLPVPPLRPGRLPPGRGGGADP